jgi:hypothetical protein
MITCRKGIYEPRHCDLREAIPYHASGDCFVGENTLLAMTERVNHAHTLRY